MRITKGKLRKVIREALLLEEPSDYYKDYRSGTISYSEYKRLVRDFENRQQGGVTSRSQSPAPLLDDEEYIKPEKIWTGTFEELQMKVHRFLIDIGFYLESHNGFVDPFSQGDHPDGGYTSNIPGVIKSAIASGEIDWASWEEIQPIYRKIDRSID